MLNAEELNFFRENGYVIARKVVSQEMCNAVVDAIFWFLQMDKNSHSDWYREPLKPGGMIEMYQHQAMWNNRQSHRLYEAFCDLLGTEKLCVSIDRVNFKPPASPLHPTYDHKGFIHWDVDTTHLPANPGLQGVLCLTDTTPDMGGFQCIPGFHKNLAQWIANQPADRNPRAPDLSRLPEGMQVTPIAAEAGDLIIWSTTLAHGNGHNVSDRPRFSQYISMFPAERLSEESREHRVNCWKHRLPPGGSIFPGDAREREQQHGVTAELSPLGRKLLGVDYW